MTPIASILVEVAKEPNTQRPNVVVKESLFATGQSAIAMNGIGVGYVTLQDCGFADVSTLVHLRGGIPWVRFEHCSAFLRNGPACRIDGETAPKIAMVSSLFARPQAVESNSEQGGEPNLIHQVGTIGDPNRVLYQGENNGFRLPNLWVRDNSVIAYNIDDFRIRVEEPVRIGWVPGAGSDKKSISPSAETAPLFAGDGVRNPDDPSPIEQFTTGSGIRDLALGLAPRDYPGIRTMLGFVAHNDLKFEAAPPGPVPLKLEPNESVVDGAGSDPGTKLVSLIAAAKTDQVFLLEAGTEGLEVPVPLRRDLPERSDASRVPWRRDAGRHHREHFQGSFAVPDSVGKPHPRWPAPGARSGRRLAWQSVAVMPGGRHADAAQLRRNAEARRRQIDDAAQRRRSGSR